MPRLQGVETARLQRVETARLQRVETGMPRLMSFAFNFQCPANVLYTQSYDNITDFDCQISLVGVW